MFGGAAARVVGDQMDARLRTAGVPPSVLNGVQRDLGWLAEVADRRKPFMAITHCLCGEP